MPLPAASWESPELVIDGDPVDEPKATPLPVAAIGPVVVDGPLCEPEDEWAEPVIETTDAGPIRPAPVALTGTCATGKIVMDNSCAFLQS